MFSIPEVLTLDSQPMGRGTVQLLNGEYGRGLGSLFGAYFIVGLWRLFVPYMTDISVVCNS